MQICALYTVHGNQELKFMKRKSYKKADEKRKELKMYFPGKKRGMRAA
jgi:hypothetical protein